MEKPLYDYLIYPKHCFCNIPEDELRRWVVKHYCEHSSTMELLASATNHHEKEIISIVALLDVDEQAMLNMMGDVNKSEHHLIHCRENVRALIQEECGE